MIRRPYLLPADSLAPFPPVEHALHEPDGLLAIGGDLSLPRLLNAYAHGIFPWFSEGQPILWWSPDPRMVFATDAVHLSRRFCRSLKHSKWTIHADTAFTEVVDACAKTPRPGQDGTWITRDMQDAYEALHRTGHAHSVEVLDDGGTLAGGIYGVAIGRMFFGESMFSTRSGGSKIALAALARHLLRNGCPLIDAQVENPHLVRMGGKLWPRSRFIEQLTPLVHAPAPSSDWTTQFGEISALQVADWYIQ